MRQGWWKVTMLLPPDAVERSCDPYGLFRVSGMSKKPAAQKSFYQVIFCNLKHTGLRLATGCG